MHTESVIQALLASGYEAASIDRQQVRAVLRRAGQAEGTYTIRLADAFTGPAPPRGPGGGLSRVSSPTTQIGSRGTLSAAADL